jgi:hypothetical protein
MFVGMTDMPQKLVLDTHHKSHDLKM